MATGRLQEVEDDATYITEKRFAEQREEVQRKADKKARDDEREESKNKSVDPRDAETVTSSNTGSTRTELNTPVEDKKGK